MNFALSNTVSVHTLTNMYRTMYEEYYRSASKIDYTQHGSLIQASF